RTIGHSFASYLKFTVSILFILQAAIFRNTGRNAWIFKFSLLLMFTLFIFDTARTTFFVCLISASYAYRFTFKSVGKNFIVFTLVFVLFMYITLVRTGIEFRFEYVLWPFFAEVIFGSYSALNALSIDDHFGFQIPSALLYFVDQFMLIIPSSILNLSGYQFNYVKVLNDASSAGLIDGKLSPLGGFFAFADLILAFSWFGAVIFSLLMFSYLSIIIKIPSILGLYLFIFFFVFLKSPLFVIINLTITAVIVLGIYKVLFNILPTKSRKKYDT
ncbi:MAG: O-antigen ligase, partial [Emcibacteraceae bacterium]|nr:O-antigen ligase [Emcibacteraceae bacterium]